MKAVIKILTLLFVIFIPIAIYFFVSRKIVINQIVCDNQYGPCSGKLLAKLSAWQGKSFPEAKEGIADFLAKNPSVSSFSLQYNFPDILKVRLLSRKPQVAITSEGNNFYLLVDEEGKIIDRVDNSSLPVIVVSGNLPDLGNKVDENLLFASKILYGAYYLTGAKKGVLTDDSLKVDLAYGVTLIFPLSGDKDVLLGAANLILSRLNNGADATKIGEVKEIDLRYKNPVLK